MDYGIIITKEHLTDMTTLTDKSKNTFKSLQEVEQFAMFLCIKYGIPDTKIEWSNRYYRVIAQSKLKNRQKIITLSTKWFQPNLSEIEFIEDSILHEIAHHLAGLEHGHGLAWKLKCTEIGVRPQKSNSFNVVKPVELTKVKELKYTYKCAFCGNEIKTHRRIDGKACRQCCDKYNKGKYSRKFVLELVD